MLQTAKSPSDLQVHRIWLPKRASDDRRPVAYVTERRRRLIGGGAMALALIGVLAVLLLHAEAMLAFAGLVIALAAGMYANGGRAGFYEMAEGGGLGVYLGRTKPDLHSMQSRRP